MKLYRQEAPVGGEVQVRWAGSQAEASAQRSAWTGQGVKRADIETEEVDVPTDKKGLMEFLNANGV